MIIFFLLKKKKQTEDGMSQDRQDETFSPLTTKPLPNLPWFEKINPDLTKIGNTNILIKMQAWN